MGLNVPLGPGIRSQELQHLAIAKVMEGFLGAKDRERAIGGSMGKGGRGKGGQVFPFAIWVGLGCPVKLAGQKTRSDPKARREVFDLHYRLEGGA